MFKNCILRKYALSGDFSSETKKMLFITSRFMFENFLKSKSISRGKEISIKINS